MAQKPKIAVCWFAGCGGCDEAIVDLNEDILRVVETFEIVLWPCAFDFKYKDIENLEEREIFLSIINGSVRNSEHEELAHLLREKSQYILAFGSCACFGGTPGLANLRGKEDIFAWVYRDAPTIVNPKRNVPLPQIEENGYSLTLPEFFDSVLPLSKVIQVDYYLPGCPPFPELVRETFNLFVSGELPPKGSTLAPSISLCGVCERNQTKPERIEIAKLRRVHETEADPEICFLAQGIICLGPATRSGCGNSCIGVNMPCRGCMGPVEGVKDMGAKYLSALASIISTQGEEWKQIIDAIEDPTGYFYRFTLPSSILERKR